MASCVARQQVEEHIDRRGPRSAAIVCDRACRRTRRARGWRTPLISMVSHSAVTPWQPSEPFTSTSSVIRARVCRILQARPGPHPDRPTSTQLGSSADSVVAPGQIRIGVQRDVAPSAMPGVDQVEQFPARPRLTAEVHRGVRQVQRAAGDRGRARSSPRTPPARRRRRTGGAGRRSRRTRRPPRTARRVPRCPRTSRACRSARWTCRPRPRARPCASSSCMCRDLGGRRRALVGTRPRAAAACPAAPGRRRWG